ncbi:MAG: tRNA glutamyl-Q(34) synthetase GluQRS [Lautropia sp.]|nr:tRNA glutamyl-Q(34) synthetase GluQRS [Lautropia sp.]
MTRKAPYIGRFAPSPSGPLHAGSIVAALASYLDAKAHDGLWLLRIEDIDPPRVEAGADARIRHQLRFLGLNWDAPPWYQSARVDRYQAAFETLRQQGRIYGCGCTRREIAAAWAQRKAPQTQQQPEAAPRRQALQLSEPAPAWHEKTQRRDRHDQSPAHVNRPESTSPAHGRARKNAVIKHSAFNQTPILPGAVVGTDETPYLGTCRHGLPSGRHARAWRFRVSDEHVAFEDRWLGPQHQHPIKDCGDFVLRRADGVWAYQLAVVVDDAEAGVTDIVRGADLLSSTGRQILLQKALGYATPRYTHLPLLMGENGQKLSKQNGAPGIDSTGRVDAVDILNDACRLLGLRQPGSRDPVVWLTAATEQWRRWIKRQVPAADPGLQS